MRWRGSRAPVPEGFGIIWVTVAVDMIGFGIVIPILGLYAEEFGATPATVGLIVASFSVAQLVLSPVLGWLSDRIGRKPVLIISLFGSAVGSLMTGLAGSLAFLFLGRIVDGGSGASVSVARAAVADMAEPRERPRLMGLLGAAFGLGFVLGPALGALAGLGDSRLPFFLAAAIATVNGVVALVRLPETKDARPAATDQETRVGPPVGRDAALVRLLVVSFLSMTAFSGFEAMFPLLGERRFGFGIPETGLVFAGIGLALVAVQVLAVGPANERWGEAGALRAGLAFNALGLLLLAYDGGWPALVVSLALLVVGQGLVTPTLTSAVAGGARRARVGASLGWQQASGSLARIVGPVLAGALFSEAGAPAPFVVGAVLAAVAGALAPRLASGDRAAAGTGVVEGRAPEL